MRSNKALFVAEWGQTPQYGCQGLPHKNRDDQEMPSVQSWSWCTKGTINCIAIAWLPLADDRLRFISTQWNHLPEVVKLTSTTPEAVIIAMKSIFSRHIIPEVAHSQNGPQDSSRVFQRFAIVYIFQHLTSSPHFPHSNGRSERAVKTTKHLFKTSPDWDIALLFYCTTPLSWCNMSLAELLMGRRMRAQLQQTDVLLQP